MKIIHTADNHLGAPLIGLSPQEARARREELTGAFLRLLRYADENGVEAVFICGDLFDTPNPSPTLLREVTDGIAACKAQVFYVTGNHDDGVVFPYMPKGFYRFEKGLCRYRLGDITVTGADYGYADSFALAAQTWEEGDCNFLLLHGEIRQSFGTQKGDIDLSALTGKPIDYLALGHIHAPSAFSRMGRGGYRYCGCLEGHGFDECGQKGFVLIDTEGGLRQTFIPFSMRNYHEVAVDISGVATAQEVEALLAKKTEDIPSKDGLKVRLTGTLSPQVNLRVERLKMALKGRFFDVKIEDESTPYIDFAKYLEDRTIKGELVRLAMALPKEERAQVLALAFKALGGEDLG